jgi:preprotein translocase subunit SecG
VFAFFVAIHVLVCVALILIVLLQAGRGGGLAGAFGAQTAQTLFGGRGAATFLSKATQWLAAAFMVMSILLAVLSTRSQAGGGEGLLQQRARARAAQTQLPPSNTSLDARAPGDTARPLVPPATPATPGTATPGAGSATPSGGAGK